MKKIFLVIAFFVAVMASNTIALGQSKKFNTAKALETQYDILRILETQYVDSLDLGKLIYTGIDAMLRSIDPYTVFFPEEDEEALDIMTTGSYGGVGAMISKVDSVGIKISQPYEGSAALKYNLEPGDLILTIEGENTAMMSVSDASSKMRGKPGTTLNMKVVKGRSGDTVDVALVRERIHVSDVVYYGMVSDTTGYLQLGGFTDGGSKELRKAFKELKETRGMKHFILDLRSNGGGLMAEAIDVLSVFLPKGTMVVSARGRDSLSENKYYTELEPEDIYMPMTVLVNSESASSSEIVAGALQDLDRATIAGVKTFGKGLVQSVRNLSYNTSLKITTAKYYTPSGRCVQAIDYSVKNPDGSVAAIPDSLKNVFKTASGRTVYDGGGITPDIELKQKTFNRPLVSLIYSGILSDYATKYYIKNTSIAPASEFVLSDKEYSDFVEFATFKEFDSRTEAEITMSEVMEAAKRDGLYSDIFSELSAMKDKLVMSPREFLEKNIADVKPILEQEIVQKYYFSRGRAESALKGDINIISLFE